MRTSYTWWRRFVILKLAILFTLGDAHIYNNHIEQVELQLTRDFRALPQLKLNPAVTNIFDFTYDDFEIVGYDPHPHIAGKVAV